MYVKQYILTCRGWWLCFSTEHGEWKYFGPFRWRWQAVMRGWFY